MLHTPRVRICFLVVSGLGVVVPDVGEFRILVDGDELQLQGSRFTKKGNANKV